MEPWLWPGRMTVLLQQTLDYFSQSSSSACHIHGLCFLLELKTSFLDVPPETFFISPLNSFECLHVFTPPVPLVFQAKLRWQRQTLLLIWQTPPLFLSYPTGTLKQDRKLFFSSFLPPCFSSLSCLHCCLRLPLSNSEPWHMHHLCFSGLLSLCLCVSSSNVQGVSLLQYVQYYTAGSHNPDNSHTAERGREMVGCKGIRHWTISAE